MRREERKGGRSFVKDVTNSAVVKDVKVDYGGEDKKDQVEE